MQLTDQEIQENEENDVNFLTSMANVDAQTARRVLKKHNGDMAKAADALLAGDRAGDWEKKIRTTPEPMYSDGMNTSTPITINLPLPSTSVIDLTADTEDDEMTRAIQMSMEESSQSVPQFGPSERAPHPDWQMVRSNDPVIPGTTTEDHTLNEAIQASLQDFREDTDITPFQVTIREGNRPIALRTDARELAYAALVVQAMYFIPQVRATVSNLRLPNIDPETLPGHPDRAMWTLIELFTNMDLAQLAAIVDNELLPSLYVEPFDNSKTLAEASMNVSKNIASLIQQHMAAQTPEGEELERLFSFSHANVTLTNGIQTKTQRSSEDGMVVTVEFGHTPHNDLISCISDNLTRTANKGSSHDVIIRPSEVITFHLKRMQNTSTSKSSPDPFVFPKTIYLDRFLFDNIQLTNNKRKKEREILEEIHRLKGIKESLTCSDNRDSLKTLRSTIYYFENVANPGGDSTRKASLERVAEHLKNIMTVIESKVEDIDHQVEKLQAEVAVIYDCPELQIFQYDLRSVLVHSGLPGRKQMYSYVQDNEGVWWKTVDLEVTEVPEETVLSDPTGLHLGAGPYLLFYSRHLSDEQRHEPNIWPTLFSEAVEENNKRFLAAMHPELEIFSNSKPSPEALPARALPIPQELQNSTHSRKNSRGMSVDEKPPH